MARFKLKENEELLYSEMHYWSTIVHRANHGTIYVTDKRVVFCATASWKQLFIELGEDQKSKNIRWEADHSRIGIIDGKIMLIGKCKWLTLDGKNTNIQVFDGFIDLINKLKKNE